MKARRTAGSKAEIGDFSLPYWLVGWKISYEDLCLTQEKTLARINKSLKVLLFSKTLNSNFPVFFMQKIDDFDEPSAGLVFCI